MRDVDGSFMNTTLIFERGRPRSPHGAFPLRSRPQTKLRKHAKVCSFSFVATGETHSRPGELTEDPPPQKKGTAPPARDSPRAPYLYRGGVEAASGRLNQRQSSTFSWRQIRTGPSIRHGLKVRDDGSNMKTDGRSPEGGGGGAAGRESSEPARHSAGFGAAVRQLPLVVETRAEAVERGVFFFFGLSFSWEV